MGDSFTSLAALVKAYGPQAVVRRVRYLDSKGRRRWRYEPVQEVEEDEDDADVS